MKQFLSRKWAWARKKPWTWASLALVLGTIGVVFVWPGPVVNGTPSDTRVRLWALVLQLLGAWTVWSDLMSAARAFNRPGVIQSHWWWIREGLGLVKEQAFALQGGTVALHAKLESVGARISASTADMEGRVKALEHLAEELHAQADRDRQRAVEAEQRLDARISEEAATRTVGLARMDQKLRDLATGNHSRLLFGACWVAIGTFLSAIAPELARIVAGQWRNVLQAL